MIQDRDNAHKAWSVITMASEKCTLEYNTASNGYWLNDSAELSDDVGHCTTRTNEQSRWFDLRTQFGASVSQVGMLLSLISSDVEQHNLRLDFLHVSLQFAMRQSLLI
jgi:hypothetical protein